MSLKSQVIAPQTFWTEGRIIIVGASLAGLKAAETLRSEGFKGKIIVIGDEPHEPYDRPPLSKQVALSWVQAEHTMLPRRAIDVEWRLGVAATGLDLAKKTVQLADGQTVEFDRLLIATGTRSRPWFNKEEAALEGVLVLRTQSDARKLQERLAAKPKRVFIAGSGFTGSELASVCCELGLPVTVADRGRAPLDSALGGAISAIAAEIQRSHGVDLRCGVTVESLEGQGQFRRAHLSDGTVVEADVAVVALGAIQNVEWLHDSGLAVGQWGVACDAGCRAFDLYSTITDDIFVAGDVARFPHPLFDYEFIALEHWGNAVRQAEIADHNMLSSQAERRPHLAVPAFWSSQFDISIKSVGIPSFGDEMVVTQGSLAERRFVAAYGRKGRLVAAVTFDQSKWLEHYEHLIETGSSFPPVIGDGIYQETIVSSGSERIISPTFPGFSLTAEQVLNPQE